MDAKLKAQIDEAASMLAKTSGDLTREEKDAEAVRMQEHLGNYETATDLYNRWSELFLESGEVDPPTSWACYVLRGIAMYNGHMTRKGLRTHFIKSKGMSEKQLDAATNELADKRLLRVIDDERGYAVYWLTQRAEELLGRIGLGRL